MQRVVLLVVVVFRVVWSGGSREETMVAKESGYE